MAVKRVTMIFVWDEEDITCGGKINTARIGAQLRSLVETSTDRELGLHVEHVDDEPWPVR